MSEVRFTRYVAIGDSQTEGLWDGDDDSGLTGFADRLAVMLDGLYPGLTYANLAVRGRTVNDVLIDQLPEALSMQPDLVTACVGMNDVTRPGRLFDRALAELEQIYAALAGSGATVVTTTIPDIGRIVPAGRLIAPRLRRLNEAIVAAVGRHGFVLVDLHGAPSMYEPRTWSDDFIHGSSRGHQLFAAAAAEALRLPGTGHEWARAESGASRPTAPERTAAQFRWTTNMLLPWVWDTMRGRSTGDGRSPRRPRLERVSRTTPRR